MVSWEPLIVSLLMPGPAIFSESCATMMNPDVREMVLHCNCVASTVSPSVAASTDARKLPTPLSLQLVTGSAAQAVPDPTPKSAAKAAASGRSRTRVIASVCATGTSVSARSVAIDS